MHDAPLIQSLWGAMLNPSAGFHTHSLWLAAPDATDSQTHQRFVVFFFFKLSVFCFCVFRSLRNQPLNTKIFLKVSHPARPHSQYEDFFLLLFSNPKAESSHHFIFLYRHHRFPQTNPYSVSVESSSLRVSAKKRKNNNKRPSLAFLYSSTLVA